MSSSAFKCLVAAILKSPICWINPGYPCLNFFSDFSTPFCSFHALNPAELHGWGEDTDPELHLHSEEACDQYTEGWTVRTFFEHFWCFISRFLPTLYSYEHSYSLEGYFLQFIVRSYYRRVVIILEIDVIKPAEDVAGKIGDPTPYTEGKASY